MLFEPSSMQPFKAVSYARPHPGTRLVVLGAVHGNETCPLLARHEVSLDLHSSSSPGVPFVFLGPPDNAGQLEPCAQVAGEEALAVRLGMVAPGRPLRRL